MNEKNYISYSENVDPIFDEEGDKIGEKRYILIDLVYVCPEDRRKGIARKMLEELITELKKQPLPVKLVALPKEKSIDIDDLVEFYESVGFSVSEEQGCSGVLMEL